MTINEEAVEFFMANAGWSYDPARETAEQGRGRCARTLAEAEAWAAENDVTFRWEPDTEPWDGDGEAPEEVYGCVATRGNETVSLWGIGDPSPEYRRVVEAELADELRTSFLDALRNHLDMLD